MGWAALFRYGLQRLSVIKCSGSGVYVLDESMSLDIVTALTRWRAMRDAQSGGSRSCACCYQDEDQKFECEVALRTWIICLSTHNDVLGAELSL